MRTLLVAAAAAALLACAGAPPAPHDQPDPARLYRSKCAACHRLYEPESRTRAGWAGVLARMARRAHLSPEQEDALHAWLAAHAADGGP